MTQELSKFGIGASEISAIAGLNPYSSPWDVWLKKTGQLPDEEPSAPMEWGIRLEPAIRQKYVDQTKQDVYVPPKSLFHPEIEWARATPDGIVVDGDHWKHTLQCKNVGLWVEKAWSEAPPVYVQLQTQWELFCTSLPRADIAVLIGGNDFRIYTVHREEKIIADLVTIAQDFWRHVTTRKQPKIDDSDACKEHFERKFSKANTVELVADAEIEQLFAEWERLHREDKKREKRLKQIRNQVRQLLAEAQADRIKSALGTAYLQKSGGNPTTETNWQLIAELLGSTKCTPEEFKALVDANTKRGTTEEKFTLYAPKAWAKESV